MAAALSAPRLIFDFGHPGRARGDQAAQGALRAALDAVEGSRRLHRYDEDQAGSRRREAGVRLPEDRSEVLSGNSGRRNVTSQSPSRMDWWIIGVNRSVDFSCLPTTSAAIRWRDPHFVGWLQGYGWPPESNDGQTPISRGGYKDCERPHCRVTMERPPFSWRGYK